MVGQFLLQLFGGISGNMLGMFMEAGEFLISVGRQIADFLIMAGQIVAALIRAALSIFGLFHAGGVVYHAGGIASAHGGFLLAHNGLGIGLGTDERLVRAKVGEAILNRPATAKLDRDYGPDVFNKYLNRGELPPRGGGGNTYNITANFKPPATKVEYDRFVRKITPAVRRRDRRRVA
jgi:hypothetical protein